MTGLLFAQKHFFDNSKWADTGAFPYRKIKDGRRKRR
jgi:hypothetical protein